MIIMFAVNVYGRTFIRIVFSPPFPVHNVDVIVIVIA